MKPISSGCALSTGRVRIRAQRRESTGSPLLWWLLTSRRWIAQLPIHVFAIEHEFGLVLYDSVLDRGSLTDPGYYPSGFLRWLYGRIARFEIGPEQTLTERRWTTVTPAAAEDESIAPFAVAHDPLGDGSLLLLPTPGHTAGSLSLLMRQQGIPPILFVADPCNSAVGDRALA